MTAVLEPATTTADGRFGEAAGRFGEAVAGGLGEPATASGRPGEAAAAGRTAAGARTGPGLPPTAAQAAVLRAQALDPDDPAHHTAELYEISGDLDPVLFAEALHRTVGETDALRVRFVDTPEGPRQVPIAIEPPGHGFPLHAADLRDQGDPDATARAWTTADLADPFDLAAGPLFRNALFRVGDRRWLWYHRAHRAALDGFGMTLVARRVAEAYSALATGAEPGPSPFGRLSDLVAEDTAYRLSEQYAEDRDHWAGRLRGAPAAPDRPDAGASAAPGRPRGGALTALERPRAEVSAAPGPDPRAARGRTAPRRPALRRTALLSPEAAERLRDLAAAVRATWSDVVIAAQALHLARTTGAEDVLLRLPMMGRAGTTALRVPGTVANVVPLRLAVMPDTTFAELTRQVALGVRDARRHQRYRFEDGLGAAADSGGYGGCAPDGAGFGGDASGPGAHGSDGPRSDGSGDPLAHGSGGPGEYGFDSPCAYGSDGPRVYGSDRPGARTAAPAGHRAGPLVQVMPSGPGPLFAGARSHVLRLASGPVDGLTVTVQERADGAGLLIDHDADPDGHDEDGLAGHQEGFLRLLDDLVAGDPHEPPARPEPPVRRPALPGMAPGPRSAPLDAFAELDDTSVALPPTTVIGPIEAWANRTPGAPAVVLRDLTVRYGELNARANRLARELIGRGVRPGAVVAVALPLSLDLIVALLAVLKAGGACRVLDPAALPTVLSTERFAAVLGDAAPRCVVTDAATAAALPARAFADRPRLVLDDPATRRALAGRLTTNPGRALTPHHPACVVLPEPARVVLPEGSDRHGSGAAPTGVVVSHAAMDNRLRWAGSVGALTPDDRVLAHAPFGSEAALCALLLPLRYGAALVLADTGGRPGPYGVAGAARTRAVGAARTDAAGLARTVREQRVTTACVTEAGLGELLDAIEAAKAAKVAEVIDGVDAGAYAYASTEADATTDGAPAYPRRILCSGGALSRETVERAHRLLPGVALHRFHGPEGSAVAALHHPCAAQDSGPVPLGVPGWNTRVRLLDAALRPCPPGVPGELYLAGDRLATGFAGRAALTAARFVADPYGAPGARMYRTGERATLRPDGTLAAAPMATDGAAPSPPECAGPRTG
ncbi:condensation domain-containing protein [Streptomyces sp. URMC 123]|uniref:condensation domain-containing protein n=1 Tax=Streptomyces sp. URMC 123 TaxID=3423403 RepID=UPI003F194F6B